MRTFRALPTALLALLALVVACSGNAISPTPEDTGVADVVADLGQPPLCTPGAQVACACHGGASGIQVCQPNGTLGACACPDAGSPDTGPIEGDCDPACGSAQVCDRTTRTCLWVDSGTDTGVVSDTGLADTGRPDVAPDVPCTPSERCGCCPAGTYCAGNGLCYPVTDSGVDAAADVPTDTPPPCSLGAYRCAATGGGLERCEASGWVLANTCMVSIDPTRVETCFMDTCALCARPDSGSGCVPFCTRDEECGNIGRARCVEGRCTRMGWTRCAVGADCNIFPTTSGVVGCTDHLVGGAVERLCNGDSVVRCFNDLNCARTHHCDAASGYCVR